LAQFSESISEVPDVVFPVWIAVRNFIGLQGFRVGTGRQGNTCTGCDIKGKARVMWKPGVMWVLECSSTGKQ